MEEVKKRWKNWVYWFLLALSIIVCYKVVDNFVSVKEWIFSFFRVIRPFLIGILIAYILIMPCRKIEKSLQKSKLKLVRKRCRGLSIFFTYIISFLIIIIVINFIFPVLRDSVVELITNIPGYYETAIHKLNELPEDSFLKSDVVKSIIYQIQNVDIQKLMNINNEKILQYVQDIFNVFSLIFDVFVSIIVSVYFLLQRTEIINFLRKLFKKILKKETFEHVDKYFGQGNEMFFKFIGSQVMDAIIVGILTSIAMGIMGVRYAALLGFMIGLFNIIPYIGAIVAVGIAIIITLITGGFGKTLLMAVVIIILQQIDANVINPKIIGNSLEISPLLVILAVTIGGAYFGIIGMFLAVPVAAVIKLIMMDFVKE